MISSESRRNGLSKGAILFEKYAFLPGVKNRQKRVKIQPFRNGFHLQIANAPREIDPRC